MKLCFLSLGRNNNMNTGIAVPVRCSKRLVPEACAQNDVPDEVSAVLKIFHWFPSIFGVVVTFPLQ